MKFEEAQRDINFSYFGGGAGVFASGLVWCLAGFMALIYSNQTSMLTLFFGGMFIHPLGMLFSKILKRPGDHNHKNPLGKLALESTVFSFLRSANKS
jgi:tellurite resistance protein TehA-like permease